MNDFNKEEKGMLYPTIDQLTKGEMNRYQLALGVARGARIITNEYVRQRVISEKLQSLQKEAGIKDPDKTLSAMIDAEYRDEKAVRVAIRKLHSGDFTFVERDEEEIASLDEEFARKLSAEVAQIAKQRESLQLAKEEEEFGDTFEEIADEEPEETEEVEEATEEENVAEEA